MRTTFLPDRSQWSELWQAAYRVLEDKVPQQLLTAWVQPLQVASSQQEGKKMSVQLISHTDFAAQWVRDHFLTEIRSAFEQVTGLECEILIDCAASGQPGIAPLAGEGQAPHRSEILREDAVFRAPPPSSSSNRVQGHQSFLLEERYTFDSYIVGASNQYAYASSFAVAQDPGSKYNPLFLYSRPGLGKTHLLHAIGNHILKKNPGFRVFYISAEQFVNELIEAIQHSKMSAFRQKYRESFDLILIDDIQFIAGKERSEEEFFHTFNVLLSSKRQLVLTSDRPPKEIHDLKERLRTRIESGLIVDIQPPEIETRIAILKAKAERDDLYLPDDVSTFLASHIKSNVRELEGILTSLKAQVSLTGAEISLEMAKQTLRLSFPEENSVLTVESILQAVAKHFQLRLQELKSSSRAQRVVLPRHIAMFLIRKYTHLQFKEIGTHFGKDHSTVVHACQNIESALESNPQVQEAVRAVQNLL